MKSKIRKLNSTECSELVRKSLERKNAKLVEEALRRWDEEGEGHLDIYLKMEWFRGWQRWYEGIRWN